MDLDIEVAEVILVRNGADTGDPGQAMSVRLHHQIRTMSAITYGSANSLSVSLMIRFGNAMLVSDALAGW